MTESKPQLSPFLRIALDLGPLVLFFFVNSRWGIFTATAVFMVTVLVALAVSYTLTRHVAMMPIVTAVVVIVFGGLTLFLQDETFIKLKPTIIYVLFGGILAGGLLMGRSLLAIVFDQVFNLTDEGWHKLTIRWVWFFFVMAVLNEIVWRTQTTDMWVNFKVFGVVPLTFVFGALQFPLLQKYEKKDSDASATKDR